MSTAETRAVPRHGPVSWFLYALAACCAARAALSLWPM